MSSTLPHCTFKFFKEQQATESDYDHRCTDGGYLRFYRGGYLREAHEQSGKVLFAAFKHGAKNLDLRPMSPPSKDPRDAINRVFFAAHLRGGMEPDQLIENIKRALFGVLQLKPEALDCLVMALESNKKKLSIVFPRIVINKLILNLLVLSLNTALNGDILQTVDSVRYPGFNEFDLEKKGFITDSAYLPIEGASALDVIYFAGCNTNAYTQRLDNVKDGVTRDTMTRLVKAAMNIPVPSPVDSRSVLFASVFRMC